MNHFRRTLTRKTPDLERLDDRIAPAHLGAAGAWEAALAHHRAALFSQAKASLHASAMPGHHFARGHQLSGPARATHGVAHAVRTSDGHFVLRTRVGLDTPAVAAPPVIPVAMTPPTPSPAPVAPASPAPEVVIADNHLPPSLPPNAGNALNTIYQEYQKYKADGGTGTFASSWSPAILMQGTDVGIGVHGNGTGDFDSLVGTLRNLGMQVRSADPVTQTVEGMLPIDELPTVALEPQVLSLSPSYRPMLS